MPTVGDVRELLDVWTPLALPDSAELRGASTFKSPKPHTVCFVREWTRSSQAKAAEFLETLFLVPESQELQVGSKLSCLPVANPRLAFGRVVEKLFVPTVEPYRSPTSVVDGAEIGTGSYIGHGVIVEAGAVVGTGVVIGHNSVIYGNVEIGNNSVIGCNTTIGGVGFGLERDADGVPIRIPHVGGVRIGNNVEIGSNCSIARGTITDTVLEDHVKLDDQVFVAHNAVIGEGTFLIAGSITSGSVAIGRRSWLSPGAVVTNGVTLGDDVLVGLGAVVVSDIPDRSLAVGLPAKVKGENPMLPKA
ncbi:hypothetical protein OVA21_12365 [Dietzia sp. SL131]|uniref:hypothetical protein n=1 Tax=Dietzia sp. SL131 TaxID=2995149 RepID=UPI00227D2FC6|nr:hypothetical protein [Dietzia sp. SL131]MCY1657977.1 hypothetical protein [Dietzia sp. SL131]